MNKEKLFGIIAEVLGVSKDRIWSEASLDEDFGVNSFDLFRIFVKIEEEFDIEIREHVTENIRTVSDLEEIVKKEGSYGF